MPVEREASDDLGARLNLLREREGLSVATLSSMLSIPEDTLEDIERGNLTEGSDVARVTEWVESTASDDGGPTA